MKWYINIGPINVSTRRRKKKLIKIHTDRIKIYPCLSVHQFERKVVAHFFRYFHQTSYTDHLVHFNVICTVQSRCCNFCTYSQKYMV